MVESLTVGHYTNVKNISQHNYMLKGAVRFGTFKSIDFKKNWYVKVPVVPRSLML